MATRYIRNTAILAKTEGTYGTDATPTEAANALLVSNVSITPLQAQNVDRNIIRPYFGHSEQLVGANYIELGFDVELAGSGTAGTAPAYGSLLKACGFTETATVSVRTEYTLNTPVSSSVTIYYFSDGVRHKALGCRGTVSFGLRAGERPMMSFRFTGLDGGIATATPSALTLSGFKTPFVIMDSTAGDLTFGASYTAATPALTGGTAYPSQGINIDLGNQVQYTPILGGEIVDVTNRQVSGSVMLDLAAADEVTFMGNVKTATLQSLGIMLGTTAGYKVMFHAPAVQLINPRKEDVNGKLMIGFDLRFTPSSGNDEFRLVIH